MTRSRPPTKGRTYRQTALEDYGLLMCSGPGCKRGWSRSTHVRGRVDNAGVIHFYNADNKPRRTGMRKFLMFVGLVLNLSAWRTLPKWQRLYLMNTWATKEARTKYLTLVRYDESDADRAYVHRTTSRRGVPLRSKYPNVYKWIYYPWVKRDA
jgi:hypothetical protein